MSGALVGSRAKPRTRILLGLVTAVVTAAALSAPVAGAVAVPDVGARAVAAGMQRLELDMTGWSDESTTLGPGAPVPAAATGIGPGSRIRIAINGPGGGTFGCTANWVWTDGAKNYLGSAGHCFLPDGATSTHGADADFDPADASVSVCIDGCLTGSLTGTVQGNLDTITGDFPADPTIQGVYVPLGPVAYARQNTAGVGIGHDFGVVEISADRTDLIRPSMPVFGGPTGVDANSTLKALCHYGHGRTVGESVATKARLGVGLGGNANQWTGRIVINHGDSGSAIQVCNADADGIRGAGAVGLVTHGAALGLTQRLQPVPGVFVPAMEVVLAQGFGTTMARAIEMTSQDAAISLSMVSAQ